MVANCNAGEIVRLFPDGKKEVVSANHKTPVGLARTQDGSLWISCLNGGIDRIPPGGQARTVFSGLRSPGVGIIADGDDAVLVADYGGTTVVRVDAGGQATVVAGGLRSPVGLVRMGDGRLLAGVWGDNAVLELQSE